MKNLFAGMSFLFLLASCAVKDYKSDSMPITHEIWDTLVKAHVTPSGVVDYSGFQKDSVVFNEYLSLLSSAHPNKTNWSKEERLAYWINAYNAFTVKIMVDNYPVKSIKGIKNGIPFVNTVWDIKFINIEGANYDLNNIEHGIVRTEFNEARIHFALNCASISCPKLRNAAYRPDLLEEQLSDQTRYFLTNRIKNQIERPEDAKLSKLFNWYSGDFKKQSGSVIKFINQYSTIKLNEDAELTYLDYLWGVNDKEPIAN